MKLRVIQNRCRTHNHFQISNAHDMAKWATKKLSLGYRQLMPQFLPTPDITIVPCWVFAMKGSVRFFWDSNPWIDPTIGERRYFMALFQMHYIKILFLSDCLTFEQICLFCG